MLMQLAKNKQFRYTNSATEQNLDSDSLPCYSVCFIQEDYFNF